MKERQRESKCLPRAFGCHELVVGKVCFFTGSSVLL